MRSDRPTIHFSGKMADAKKKKKKTLFDLVKPLVLGFNFFYGFNLGNRKPAGCVKRLRKGLQIGLASLLFFNCVLVYYLEKFNPDKNAFNYRWLSLIVIFCCSFYLFAFNEQEMERLVLRLKGFSMGEKSWSATSKITAVGLCSMALLLVPRLVDLSRALPDWYSLFFTSILTKSSYDWSNVSELVLINICFCFILLLLGFLITLMVCGLLFPILISCLCCALVSYCPSRLDDHVEDILRAHSPLRRARLLSKLCYDYYKLQQLASMTNRNTATAMSMFKVFTLFQWAIYCRLIEENAIVEMYNVPLVQYSTPLLMYLLVAPSANDMRCKVFEAVAEVLMVDDEWQVRDPISRSLLMKMRLNLLQHLVHIEMDNGPFTLLGELVDPTTLFTTAVEINDLRTTL